MSTSYLYKTTKINDMNQPPKFSIVTEPHYKIKEFLEEETSINVPNRKMLNKIIKNAYSRKKYQGSMDLDVPGNKNVLTDSDSERPYLENDYMKKINKNMLKQNGSANLIIKKIESKAPQRNEEYYKFTNQRRYYRNDPIYGTRTLANWNHQMLNEPKIKKPKNLYIQTEEKYFNKKDYYTNDRILTTSSNTNKKKAQKRENNIRFDSSIDLRNITFSNKKKNIPINEINYTNNQLNQQIDYESSADAEQGSSSYVYIPNKNPNIKNKANIQQKPNNEVPYKKKNLEIKTHNIRRNYKLRIPTSRPTINELINLNFNNNKAFSVLQNKFNQKLIKNVVVIQSIWRGYFTREIIKKNMNLIRLLVVIIENIKNKYFEYITDIFYALRNMKTPIDKNENYYDLLKDYNIILREYEKLEKELNEIKKINKRNHFDKLNIVKKENNFEILDINLQSKKGIIQPEQKEQFSIINTNENELKLRNKPKKENIDNILNILNITNPAQFMLGENKPPLVSKEPEINNKNVILIEETQKDMDIELTVQRKFLDNITQEKKNDINIIPITIAKNNLVNKSIHEFNNNDLIIVKKIALNIKQKENQNKNNNLMIEKNNICIKKSKTKHDETTEIKSDVNNKTEETPIKIFTERAKQKMMKMMLPIRLKGILKQFAQKKVIKFFQGLKKG